MNGFWIYSICNDPPVLCDKLHHFVESGSFHLLPFQVTEWILHEVKEHTALSQLLYEQLFSLRRGSICTNRKKQTIIYQVRL